MTHSSRSGPVKAPKTTNRDTAARDAGPVEHRLARLLDTLSLARVVPHLAPETLHQLIHYRGLDACGELVTSATPAQLTSLLDLDLWRRAQPGRDERFDVDRFGEWLEVLLDTGESVAARTVAALDKSLVIAGLSRYVRVFDPGTFEPTAASDDEPMDRHEMMNSETSGDLPECDIGGYLLRARRTDAWDAIVTLLAALEIEHNDDFQAVMQGCRRLSNSRPEIDGLDDLLQAPEQHLHDVAVERERRQSRHGYATPGDARAFLQMARQPQHFPTANSIVTYFREGEEEEKERGGDEGGGTGATAVSTRDGDDEIATSVGAVVELLAEAVHLRQGDGGPGVMPARARALLPAAGDDSRAAKLAILRRLMEFVAHVDEAAYLARGRELAFLANTFLAGSSVQSRPFTPQEASDAAACVCNLGLECWPARWARAASQGASATPQHDTAALPDAFLVDHDLVTAFAAGWSVLYEDVSLFVADRLISTLADLRSGDTDIQRGLRTLQQTLVKQREAGTPWRARAAADVLATLDMTAWISVLGLLDECPILPTALTAILERRTTPVSATGFEFISTTAQIGVVRLFMRTLPHVLSR